MSSNNRSKQRQNTNNGTNTSTVTSYINNQDIPTLTNNVISKDLLLEALTVEAKVEPQKEKNITSEQLINFTTKVAEFYKIPNNIAYVGICSTLQAGGSNKNKRSNVKITIQGNVFESKKVNELIQQNLKITPRQLARIIANDIFVISSKHQITGNAYVSLKRFYPNLLTNESEDEKYWAADFQVDNIDCPEYIRNALRQRYADKFISNKKN